MHDEVLFACCFIWRLEFLRVTWKLAPFVRDSFKIGEERMEGCWWTGGSRRDFFSLTLNVFQWAAAPQLFPWAVERSKKTSLIDIFGVQQLLSCEGEVYY